MLTIHDGLIGLLKIIWFYIDEEARVTSDVLVTWNSSEVVFIGR
jgi:hypothetical protein